MSNGATFNVDCWQPKDWVTRVNNIWLHGTYNSPTRGPIVGDASDVYVDTHWKSTNDLVAQGIERCGTAPASVAPPPSPSESAARPLQPRSVFFSPWTIASGLGDVKGVSDMDISLDAWSNRNSGDCYPEKAAQLPPDSVDTLSGWSRGRMGVIYYLAKATEARKSNIHKIVLFDPGDSENIGGLDLKVRNIRPGCDLQYNPAELLSNWLKKDGRNQLIVVAGKATEEKADPNDPNSKSTFAGMWKYYFPKIWNQPFADRAMVCDYNYLDHDNALRLYTDLVKSNVTTCPPDRKGGHTRTQWHP